MNDLITYLDSVPRTVLVVEVIIGVYLFYCIVNFDWRGL